MSKKSSRIKRSIRVRTRIPKSLGRPRLSVHRTLQHTFAQVIAVDGMVIASCSDHDIEAKGKKKVEVAFMVGEEIAKRAIAKKVKMVAFDRSGFKYHGRIKALCDGARKGGLTV